MVLQFYVGSNVLIVTDMSNQSEIEIELNDEYELRIELDEVQKALDANPTDSILREEHCVYVQAFNEAKLNDERFLKQKAKVDWLEAGDINSAYFYKTIKCRNQRSRIDSILNTNNVEVSGSLVPNVFVFHYEQFLGSSTDCNIMNEEGLFSNKVPIDIASNMVRDVTNNEIKAAMFDIGDDRAPGPDGYTSVFFKKGWNIIGDDICNAELMHNYHRNQESPRCAFKIDIQKAYDTADWKFLENILIKFGFHNTMVKWIMACVSSTSFSLSISGNIHGFFKGKRGLRQGDPISLYLFTLVMEILTLILKRPVRLSESFRYHRYCEEIQLINMCFADDLFIFSRGDVDSSRVIMDSLKEFKLTLGLIQSIPKRIIYDIHQLIRGFLWCNGELKRGKAKIAWDDICLPKSEGGLALVSSMADLWQWRDQNGNISSFSIAKAWEANRSRGNVVACSRIVWFSHNNPRHAFHLWLVMRHGLKTHDKMRQWDVGGDTNLNLLRCALCNNCSDSHTHLFFECTFSAKIWSYVRDLVGMDLIPPVLQDILLYLLPMGDKRTVKSVSGKLILAAYAYFIWMERNNRTFKNTSRSPEEICDLVMVTVQLKLISFRFKNTNVEAISLEGVSPVLVAHRYSDLEFSFGKTCVNAIKLGKLWGKSLLAPDSLLGNIASKITNIDGKSMGNEGKLRKAIRSNLATPGTFVTPSEGDTSNNASCEDDNDKNEDGDAKSSMNGDKTAQDSGDNLSGDKPSFASIFKERTTPKAMRLAEMTNSESLVGADVAIPVSAVEEVSNRFKNTLLERLMLKNGFFFFQFATSEGMERVLEDGPWLIRLVPIILNILMPNTRLAKETITTAPIWVKLHNVPVVAFLEVGLSLITYQLGHPIMLDAYNSTMCQKSWGRNTYARVLIEVSSLTALKESLAVAIPFPNGTGHSLETVEVVAATLVKDDGFMKVTRKHGKVNKEKGIADVSPTKTKKSYYDDEISIVSLRNSFESLKEADKILGIDTSWKDNPVNELEHDEEDIEEMVMENPPGSHKPWCVLGDFNMALYADDKSTSSSSIDMGMHDFQDCVEAIEIFDVHSTCLRFTWNQKLNGADGILKKIYHIMANLEFNKSFIGSCAVFQEYRISDLRLCFEVVANGWLNSVSSFWIFKVVKRLKSLKKPMRKMLFDHGNIYDNVKKLRHELDDAQKALDSDPNNLDIQEEEAAYLKAYHDALIMEARFLMQKAKLFSDAAIHMVRDVTDNEIRDAIFSMGDNKAPGWIMKCVTFTSFSLSINGYLHGYFKGKSGLHQGDPMSPYLFTLVMKVLTLMLKQRDRDFNYFTYHRYCSKLNIINLCFDDASFFFFPMVMRIRPVSLWILWRSSKNISRLTPILPKSTAYFCNVLNHVMLSILSFEEGKLPVKYLGVPLVLSRLLYRDCFELMEKVKRRICDWKNKSLSLAGRAQLIRSVLGSMHLYWASVFILLSRLMLEFFLGKGFPR
uniref:Reverse transcriptase domain-containing protein n=1 Tax=Tanacetum cinerariifolium TaxID=118510 RepID=A0A6L2MYS2_TANCI|nr:hypothetical protein [Tanacetum cinerariifolium]